MQFRLVAFIFLGIALQFAVAQTCSVDWTMPSACLDISNLDGKTVTLPSNVTRLNSDGLSLCPLKTNGFKFPAVVFMVDHSASMDNGGGDPHHSRAGLIRQSIQYLYDQAGSGWISYIEFANGIETPLKTVLNPTIFSDVGCVKYNGTATNTLAMDFVSMNDSIVANWTDTSGPVQNRCQNSTTYKAPIERSMQYFQNLNPGNVGVSPAVIFFSDGAPTDYTGAGGLVNLIKFIRTYTGFPGKYPPIYTIFSGNAINAGNGVYMQAMADSTGGTYTQVTPGDVTQITLVMNQILESISKSSKPASVSLTVNGVSYSGTTAIQQSGGAQVTFSSSMPLLSGDNSAQLKVEFIDSVGVSQTHTSSFTLQVNATAEDTGAFPIDTIFSGVCAVANTITVNGLINPLLATSKTLAQIPHLLTDSLNQLSLQLQANRFTSSTAQLLVTSRRTGDSVRYSLPVTSSSGKYLRDLPVQIVGQDSLGIPKQGIRTDSLLQAAPFDTLDLWWQNPTDARDTIRSSLLFYRTPKIDFVGDTLSVEQIKAMVSDASVTGQSVVVEYRWLTGDSVSTGNLLRKDSSLSFLGMTNFHTELQSMLSDRLVVSYIDPVFHTVYLDTAFLLPVDNKITVNGLVNPLLVTGATFVRTPYILTDSLNQLTLQLQSNRYISSSAQLLLISRRTGDSVSVRLTSTSTSGGYQGDLPVQFLGQDTLGNPNRGIRTDSLLQSSPFDTLDLRWQNPTDARDTVRASVLFYRTPKVAFTSDTLDIGKINVHITDASALGLTVTVDYQWLTSDTISKGTLPRTDSSLSFYGFANLHAKLLSTKDNGLIVIYTDPIFDIVYRDTVYLTYPRPAVPVASILDVNGDGRADQVTLLYSNPPTDYQHFPSYRFIWGNTDQDTMLLRVDSLDPSLSTEVVSISTTTEGGEQWIFNLKDPFPFAHTHGSGPNGQGSIIMTGWFDSLDIEQTIELEDKVGPVLTEMWLDPWDKTRSYFRVSEPLASLNQENWIFDKRLGAPEWTPQTDSLLFNESTGIYTLRVKNEPRNLILGNDSARLVSSTIEGIVDRNGNRPHLSNPYVVVRGTRGSANSLVTAFVNPLLQSDVNAPTLPPQSADSTGDFHVLILNPLTRQFEEPSGETVDQHFAKSMLTLRVDAALPQLYGTDSSGNALQGMMVNGVLAWSTDIQVRGYFYDLLGQFITSKMAHITIDNVHQINENGSISLALVWVSDPLIGLVSRSGRAVGTGVILATVQADITSTSLFDLPVYESDGSKSTKSIDKGKVIHNKKKSVTKIGYYRQ